MDKYRAAKKRTAQYKKEMEEARAKVHRLEPAYKEYAEALDRYLSLLCRWENADSEEKCLHASR
jgi:hypothetical protein